MEKETTRKIKPIEVGEYWPINDKDRPNVEYWDVRVGKDDWFFCHTQAEAEIISRLVRIENLLKRKKL